MNSELTVESTDGVNSNHETSEAQFFPSYRKIIHLKSIQLCRSGWLSSKIETSTLMPRSKTVQGFPVFYLSTELSEDSHISIFRLERQPLTFSCCHYWWSDLNYRRIKFNYLKMELNLSKEVLYSRQFLSFAQHHLLLMEMISHINKTPINSRWKLTGFSSFWVNSV